MHSHFSVSLPRGFFQFTVVSVKLLQHKNVRTTTVALLLWRLILSLWYVPNKISTEFSISAIDHKHQIACKDMMLKPKFLLHAAALVRCTCYRGIALLSVWCITLDRLSLEWHLYIVTNFWLVSLLTLYFYVTSCHVTCHYTAVLAVHVGKCPLLSALNCA